MANSKPKFVFLEKMKKKEVNKVQRNEKGQVVYTTENALIVPLAVLEALLVGTLMALNYIFRYDSKIRYSSDMVDFKRVELPCDEDQLFLRFGRPFFSYSVDPDKSLDGLELKYDLPEWVFFLCAILTPSLIICLVEGVRYWRPLRWKKEVEFLDFVIIQPFRRIVRIIGVYLLGGCIAGLVTCIFKFNITSPRPHFMSVCFPNYAKIGDDKCSQSYFWSPSEKCTNTNDEDVVEALKSFPSYHATLAVYSGTFVMAYLARMGKVRGFYTGPILMMLGLTAMMVVGATHRLSSGHSFPGDVVGGAFIGIVCVYFVVTHSLEGFRERRPRPLSPGGPSNSKPQSRSSKPQSEHRPSRKRNYLVNDDPWDAGDSDSDFDSGGSSEYHRVVSKIEAGPIIPRVKPESQPMQAVNPAMRESSSSSSKKAEEEPQPPRRRPPPSSTNGASIHRSHSSVGRTWRSPTPSVQPSSSYNDVQRQRNSAPMSQQPPVGYTNYGYATNDRRNPDTILSAFQPPLGHESTFHF